MSEIELECPYCDYKGKLGCGFLLFGFGLYRCDNCLKVHQHFERPISPATLDVMAQTSDQPDPLDWPEQYNDGLNFSSGD